MEKWISTADHGKDKALRKQQGRDRIVYQRNELLAFVRGEAKYSKSAKDLLSRLELEIK